MKSKRECFNAKYSQLDAPNKILMTKMLKFLKETQEYNSKHLQKESIN